MRGSETDGSIFDSNYCHAAETMLYPQLWISTMRIVDIHNRRALLTSTIRIMDIHNAISLSTMLDSDNAVFLSVSFRLWTNP
jgi:hypothetical protein